MNEEENINEKKNKMIDTEKTLYYPHLQHDVVCWVLQVGFSVIITHYCKECDETIGLVSLDIDEFKMIQRLTDIR